MRRGLKHAHRAGAISLWACFKPIPDEEGTETLLLGTQVVLHAARFKPIPDEEGTETLNLRVRLLCAHVRVLQTDPR